MTRKVINVTFQIETNDYDKFLEAIAKYEECEKDDVTNDDILEYISNHVTEEQFHSKSDVFSIMGTDTDGPFIEYIDTNS